MSVCMYTTCLSVGAHEEGSTRVKVGSALPCGCWGLNLGFSSKDQVFLAADPFLAHLYLSQK